MRYLKAIAQDLGQTGQANTVLLKFYNDMLCLPEQQVGIAVAVDHTGDALVDFAMAGDIDLDGRFSLRDQHLLRAFTDVFLQLNWFNQGGNEQRYLKMLAENYHHDGSPNVVNGDNDGIFESFTNSDVDGNGIADTADKELIRRLIKSFLAFDAWSTRLRS